MTEAAPIDDTRLFASDQLARLAPRLKKYRRILIWGDMGVGKSTLAMALSRLLSRSPGRCQILQLDPGRPPFGIPGAVSRGWWNAGRLEWADSQALCSLDAARFRLPLVLAARRLSTLMEQDDPGPAVIDPPGVVRGVGGAELLTALAEALGIDAVVACFRREAPLQLAGELSSLSADLFGVPASEAARRPSTRESAEYRTRLWNRYLSDAVELAFPIDRVPVLGTPPPRQAPSAWPGRQAGLLDAAGRTLRMGEVIRLSEEEILTLKMAPGPEVAAAAILIRDAGRNAAGLLTTFAPVNRPAAARHAPAEMTPPAAASESGQAPVSSRMGAAWATLVGGVFGDPLLHVRLRNLKQSYLFDLGDPGRLPAKVAHQVRAVFLSHAHIDHIGGFLWLLRSRIGRFGPCRIFGPAATIARINNYINAVTWDRIEDNAPVFEVFEIVGATLNGARLQPGAKLVLLPGRSIADGTVLRGEGFSIRAIVCDHGIASVAYALELHPVIGVRKERLAASRLRPGPWIGRLKRCLAAGKPGEEIELPDKRVRSAGEIAEELLAVRSGEKLVYAADMADTPQNRGKLIELARSAHTLFCETAFTQADKQRAAANQHLTTLSAVEIARQAGVKRLVPFHFSKRYEHNPRLVYDEILAAAGSIEIVGRF